MREVTVATVQMKPALGQMEDNLVKMSDYVTKITAQQRVDLIVFPELATTGYECGKNFTDLAQRVPGSSVNVMAQRAQEAGVHIAFGLPSKEKVESIIFNSAVLIGPDGEVIGDYRKVHLKDEERMAFRAGFRYMVFECQFGIVGLMLGYDLAFPEVSRSLALDGAELIVACANWAKPHQDEWRTYVLARAYENSCFIAAANRVGSDVTYTFFGDSMIVGPRGQVYASLAGETDPKTGEPVEGYCLARLDLSEVRKCREEFQTLQNREPDSYKAIVKKY
ncbi:MAG: carbon-nitrogen hydrolase family protein [Chloroflexi bacterium]|nr:carbon-nitrogen hydrolase family protein [Chloroflexota bacterium]MBI3764552.1 carbon-nitrogen hydrolase family protein [Chloroflexota bacterium]